MKARARNIGNLCYDSDARIGLSLIPPPSPHDISATHSAGRRAPLRSLRAHCLYICIYVSHRRPTMTRDLRKSILTAFLATSAAHLHTYPYR